MFFYFICFTLFDIIKCSLLNEIGKLYLDKVGKDAIENSVIDPVNSRIFSGSDYSTGINVLSFEYKNDLPSMNIIYEDFISFKGITSKRWFPRDRTTNKITIDDVPATLMSPKGYLLALAEPKYYQYYEGFLVFIDPNKLRIFKVIKLKNCYAPSHMDVTSDGNTIVIACEGTPSKKSYNYQNPEGTVQIIDVKDIGDIKQSDLNFNNFNYLFDENYKFGYDVNGNLHSTIYRQFKSAPFAQNAEPEYVTISTDNKYAFICLQDINAVAVVQLNNDVIENSRIIRVYGLGLHSINVYDDSVNSYGMDISDKDGINIKKHPNLYALKQPDSIKYFEKNGKHYILTANEGTEKDFDETRIYKLQLNDTHFKGFDTNELKKSDKMGRLQVSNLYGYKRANNTKIYNTFYVFGSRNFDIFEWDPVKDTFTSIYNSKDDFEQITASILGENGFNSHNKRQPSFDQASDNQGPEPESIMHYKCNNNNEYVFVGLEKVGGIFSYNVKDIDNIKFVEYTLNRNYSVYYSSKDRPSIDVGDIEPSDIKIIDEKYFGKPLVVVSNEHSSSLTVYTINCNENNDDNNPDTSNADDKKSALKIAPSSQWYVDAAVITALTLLFGILTYVFCKCCSKRRHYKRMSNKNDNKKMLVQV